MASSSDPIDILRTLIAFDSVSANPNRPTIDWIAQYLDDHGVAATVLPADDGRKANLYATIGPQDEGGIVWSGHTDVVPVTGQSWSSDPFELTERAGRFYGRGTADMKGFVALALSLVPDLVSRDLKVPIHLAFSYDEEVGCRGVPEMIDHVVDNLPRPRLAIIGEPTSMKPINGHKGILAFRTTVTGKDAHSSQTQLGASAVRTAAEIVDFLYRMGDDLKQKARPGNGFVPPETTINVGMIDGGTALNIIAAKCTFTWDVRATPYDDTDAILHQVWDFIDNTALPRLRAQADGTSIETEQLADAPALRPDPEGEAEQLIRQITGANEAGKVAFGTEAGLFQRADIPAVVIGPGDIAQAHQPDEFITRDQLDHGHRFLCKIADWATA